MKSIKTRFNLLLFAIFLSAGLFGYMAYSKYMGIETVQKRLSRSLSLRGEISKIDPKDFNEKTYLRLKKIKHSMVEDYRREAVSDVIQAYSAHNSKLFTTRVAEFDKSEMQFFKNSNKTISSYKKSFRFYVYLVASIPFVFIFMLFYYFNFILIKPLQGLSIRMMEFLVDQYTFRFSRPTDNEIGNLERTFNSLAQKVLNNMDELKALDQAKSDFVSIASHELRTPLTSIKGSLGLLSNEIVGKMDEEAKKMVGVAEEETDRLVRLINDLLDLAKIESRSFTLKKDWCLVTPFVEKTLEGLRGFAQAADVKLQCVPPPQKVEAHMDMDRIQQVLTNLISNAIKFSPKGGTVTVEFTVTHSDFLFIGINDQGPGISEENQQLIFEKFRQATSGDTPLVKGTGLGLAISKVLVEEHGGNIGVESETGNGSTFYFTLRDWREKSDDINVTDEQEAA